MNRAMLRVKSIGRLAAGLSLVAWSLDVGAQESALRVEGGLTAVHQAEVTGPLQDTEASGDLFVYLPTTKGEWLLYIEAASTITPDSLFNLYPEINADAGTALDSRNDSRVQISELNFRWDLAQGQHLTMGEIDPSAYLDRSRIANDENSHFLGASFVNNPTIEFPDYALGFMYRIDRTANSPEITAIVSSSDGLADNPGRSYRELVDVADHGKGIFLGLGGRWAISNARVSLGGWYRSDEHQVLDNAEARRANYGIYALYGWQTGSNGVNLRAGAANSAVSPAAYFLGAAYEGVTRIGAVGLGVGKIYESPTLGTQDTGNTLQAETFLRVRLVGETSHLTFSLQYIENPGFDTSDRLVDSRALIAGLRLHLWFTH